MSADIKRVAQAALEQAGVLLPQWLPDGRRAGHEWQARNPRRDDAAIGSFSINLRSGVWADFATGDTGGDLVSLYAYLHGITQGEAAQALAGDLGIGYGAKPPQFGQTVGTPLRVNQKWAPVVPVPDAVPPFALAHKHYGRPLASWEYRDGSGARIGYVCRFAKSDGGKEIMPAVWARNVESGEYAWRWLSFPKPRPLYGLPELATRPDAPVMVVEGEKCVDAVGTLLPGWVAVTWPGGAQAVKHADWQKLAGRRVTIWPDADEPGLGAARAIALLLQQGVAAAVCVVQPPAGVAAGWDLADALAEGWTGDRVCAHMTEAAADVAKMPPPPAVECAAPAARATVISEWRERLIWGRRGLVDCRENVYLILRDHPEWAGVLAYDEFGHRIVKRRPAPCGGHAGDWDSADDLRLGLWLAQRPDLELLVRSERNLALGVKMAADEARYHPVREYLERLEWDRVPRIDSMLMDYFDVETQPPEYLALVARFWLLGMIARIYEPGCVMRLVPVLEGPQNRGKSTALKLLAQPWFSDTPFSVGEKDAYLAIQRVWLYEIAELDSFNKSEATRVKAFISSTVDNFRAPFEPRNTDHPRQVVFAGTTNHDEYAKDPTGNSRFAGVSCGDDIRLDSIAAMRDQLMAEAIDLYRQRARRYASRDEEARWFKPQQEAREVQDPWAMQIAQWLAKVAKPSVTLLDVLYECLKVEPDRVDGARQMAMRVGYAMKAAGWRKRRESSGARQWYWERPAADGPTVARVQSGAPEAGHVPF